MGDTIDGSSGAALGAQSEDQDQTGGFFKRLFSGAKSPDLIETPETLEQSNLPTGDLRNLQSMRLEDVAVPRADVTAVSQDIELTELVKVFKESGYSRLPVYKDQLDNPVGFIHLKDFALKYGFNGTGANFAIKPMLRPLLFAPPSMAIGVLLQKMQADRIHMALVIDEYGGVDGLLTIEDLVETVLGEIVDEHDTEEDVMWAEEKPGVYLAQSRASLSEFEQMLDMGALADDDAEEIDTLGGLVFMLTGRVPAKGEIIPHPSGIEFEIVDADPRRIKRLRVTRDPARV
ncbi:hemolysin family protein [Neptunicoccus sediminis]|uniref:hemolysin family protein n=1 Tax=Neptunicoccus sediminis TaxID=1892596 RepID=UPI000845F4AA|nr:hemolysin family protein [Neptunicoccus sediminis]